MQKTINRIDCQGSDADDPVRNALRRIMQSETFKMKQRELKLAARYQKQKQNVLVSVIMPTWNRSFIIKRAINSVIEQSYRNFELIISDDGSTDGTGDIIRREYGADHRITYIYNEHRGVSYARNSALKNSNGQLVAYLDTDNQWGRNYLLVMANALLDCPNKASAYCGIRVINNMQQARFTRLVDYDRISLVKRNYIDMNIFIHQKSILKKHGGFKHDVAPLEDWELIMRYTKNNPPLVVKCCLANYHIAKDFNHQTLTQDIDSSYQKIRAWYDN